MAIANVHQGQTAAATASSLAITSAVAGHILIVFISQTVSIVAAPTGSDNISGATGWTTNATKSTFSATGVDATFVMYKVAVGGETTITATAGTGGTVQGLAVLELSGASLTIDTIVVSNTTSTALTTTTSGSVTTSNAGSIILAGIGQNAASGAIGVFTGTGPMTRVSSSSTRCIGGYYLPGSTVSGATFTANWANSNAAAMLILAIEPAGAAPINVNFFQMM